MFKPVSSFQGREMLTGHKDYVFPYFLGERFLD